MSAEIPAGHNPGDWDDFYAGARAFLVDWLEECGPLGNQHSVIVCTPAPARFEVAAEILAAVDRPPDINYWILTKTRYRGLAPYVGRPFAYRWNVGQDRLGRAVAGNAWRAYDLGTPWLWADWERRMDDLETRTWGDES